MIRKDLLLNILKHIVLSVLLLGGLTSFVCAQQNDRSRQLTQPELSSQGQITNKRIALVIGNGNYQNAPKLNNPVNDARDIALILRVLGFGVVEREDQTAEQMKRLIKEFGDELSRSKGVGLFYFAGHGVQVKGKNYLIPVEAKDLGESSVEFDAVDVGRVLTKMEDAANDINIVILDACRSNPFTRSWRSSEVGLAQISTPRGTIIAYATAPGAVADDGNERNGLYTSELMRWIKQPGLNIEEMFKRVRTGVATRSGGRQVPSESTMLMGDFYFSDFDERSSNNIEVKKSGKAINTPDIELAFWERIKSSTNSEDFVAYLNLYPNGRFSQLAKTRSQQPRERDSSQRPGEETQTGKERDKRFPNKAGQIVLSWGVWNGNRTDKEIMEIFACLNEFLPSLVTSLQRAGLSVTERSALDPNDEAQISGATQQIENGQQSSARSVAFSINVFATIGIEDRPTYGGMHVSIATISLKAFDLTQGKIVAAENITEAKGFGINQTQARRNALREAGQNIPETFINKVALNAR
jgi:hypothetical protein